MKKILCVVLALMLVMVAVAEQTPSKTVEDMTIFTPEVEGLVIEEVKTEEADEQLEVLAAADTLEEYFGEDTIAAVKEITGNEYPGACELMSIRVSGYKDEMGDVKTNAKFISTFEEGNKIATLVGFAGNDGIDWNVIEGLAQEDGSLDIVFPGEMLSRIQDEGAFPAVIK